MASEIQKSYQKAENWQTSEAEDRKTLEECLLQKTRKKKTKAEKKEKTEQKEEEKTTKKTKTTA